MNLDTAQPATAAETEGVPVSKEEALAEGADAFKIALGQMEAPPERTRGPDGRFIAEGGADAGDADEEIEAQEPDNQSDDGVESQDDDEADDEAAEEAQPAAVDLPASWTAEHAETWKALPPETQAIIAEREGQRDAAVNQKFQEAANLRKAHEGEISEARTTRTKALEAIDIALNAITPQEPPLSMLDAGSPDYDPDGYHLAKAQHQQTLRLLDGLAAQQQDMLAQERQENERASAQLFQEINAKAAPALFRDAPEMNDETKRPAFFAGLIEYAVAQGAPIEVFQSPTNALEWHTLWKAREYDRLQAAKAKVRSEPKPEPRKAGPAVRPGVAVAPGARRAAARQKDFDRLAQSGSIADGAAVFKHFLK